MEFLVSIEFRVPPGTSDRTVSEKRAEEALRARELAEQGHLKKLWRLANEPQRWANVGIWAADDSEELYLVLATLPLHPWATISVTPLGPHPNDPGGVS